MNGTPDGAPATRVERVLSQLSDDSVELVDPPTEIWAAIDAELQAERVANAKRYKQPPARVPSSGGVVEYWLSADDVVDEVGAGWHDFAMANDAPELAEASSGRPLWGSIESPEMRDIWRLLIEHVRSQGTSAVVPLRCDGPSARRWFEMTITPLGGGRLHFRSVLSFEEEREPVSLLDPTIERDADVDAIELCGWCGRGRADSGWLDIEELARRTRVLESHVPATTYGVCRGCHDEMTESLVGAGRGAV